MHHLDPKTGEVEEEEVKNAWVDPTNEGAPAGKEVHVAVTPDTENQAKTDQKASKEEDNTALGRYNKKKRHKEPKPGQSVITGGKPKKKKR